MKQKAFVILVGLVIGIISTGSSASEILPKEKVLTKQLTAKAMAALSASLNDQDSYNRAKAVEVVSNAKVKGLLPKVEKLLGDDYVPVRFAAAVAIGDMCYKQSAKRLEMLISAADDDTTKIGAAFALAKLGNKKYLPLIDKALTSKNQNLKANAAMLIGKLGDKAYIETLYKIFKDENASDAAIFSAAEAIAALGDNTIYKRLWTMLISKHPDDRIMGIKAMSALATDQAKDAIGTMLYDEVLEVRLAAAMELGKTGDKSGWQDVHDVFTKPIEQIDAEAIARAYQFKHKDKDIPQDTVIPEVTRTAAQKAQAEKRAKTLAAIAVGWIDHDQLTAFLPQLLDDPDKNVRLAAAQSALLLAK